MTIDFNQLMKQADAAGFTVIPDGRYDAIVTKAEVKPTSTQKQMIKVQYEVDGGPHNKRKLFNQHVLSPDNDNALRFFFEDMAGYGLTREYWASPQASLEAAAQYMIGRPVTLEVGNKEYPKGSNEFRNEVNKVKPRDAGISPVVGGAPAVVPGPGAVAPAQPGPGAIPPVVVPQPATTPAPAPVQPGPAPVDAVEGDEEPF